MISLYFWLSTFFEINRFKYDTIKMNISINICKYVGNQLLGFCCMVVYICLSLKILVRYMYINSPKTKCIKTSKLFSVLYLSDYIWHNFVLYFTATAIVRQLSLIHISEPTRPLYISYAVFCLKKIGGMRCHALTV